MKDFYEILGVSPNADMIVISAAYKALVQIYHPDKWKGEKKVGEKKIRDINEAYETLKDKAKKEKYDQEYFSSNRNENADFDDDTFSEEYAVYEKIIVKSWNFAKEYFPEIENYYKELKKINKKLAWQFQVTCVEDKCYENSKEIHENLKKDFIERYFGKNKELNKIALRAIIEGNKKIAKEINQGISILGEKASQQILDKIILKYPIFFHQTSTFSHKGFKATWNNKKKLYEIVATRAFGRGYLGETFKTIEQFETFINKRYSD